MAAYGGFATALLNDWFTGKTIGAMLVLSTYTQDIDVDAVVSDISTNETAAAGYSRQTLATVTVTYDSDIDEAVVTCDPLDFGTFTAGETALVGTIFFVDTGDDTTSTLIAADISDPYDVPVGFDYVYTVDVGGFTAAVVASSS